ncbi:flagellar filament capping protein FliD [Hydrogenophaga sp.]|uniref:flagellar filament capping protein FliD n=1 Tax=Hydrogenophaga sp. TaxID=1904254 RepID=UPI0019B342FE|nr:flagellar filament capping protein FliD [Hydrogenophaga sp.]MBD3893127.1 flagellar cap protein FliD [Hydrogenophaga sp.]
MATISAPGIGSGLDVKGIVTQLVALERAPLRQLQTQAASLQTRLSTFGSIQSQVSALGDAAARLARPDGWNAVSASSSNPAAVGVSAAAGAPVTSLTLTVQQLARSQSTTSVALASASTVGAGALTLQLGRWSGNAFTPGSAAPVSLTIDPLDTLASVASKINAAATGVSASVLRDAAGERLLLRSSASGEANGFRITANDADGTHGDASGLSRLAFDAANPAGQTLTQAGQDARATVNGVAITSASNRLNDALDGLTIELAQVTAEPVELRVSTDLAAARKNIEAFVAAYNTLNTSLTTATRFDAGSRTAGPLQGDATAIGLQNALRGMLRSVSASSPFARLSDIGIEMQTGGALQIRDDRLNAALSNFQGVRALFTLSSSDPGARGFGLKVDAFADGLIAADGMVSTKKAGIQQSISRNGREQDRVNERAQRVELRLLAQYNAMDAQVGRLNSLNAFVTQQITLWNRSTG